MWLTILKPGVNRVCAAAYSFFVFIVPHPVYKKTLLLLSTSARLISIL